LSRRVGGQSNKKLVDEKRQVREVVAVERRLIEFYAGFLTLECRGCNGMEIVCTGSAAKRVELPLQSIGRFPATINADGQRGCNRCNAIRHRLNEALFEVEQSPFESGRGFHDLLLWWRAPLLTECECPEGSEKIQAPQLGTDPPLRGSCIA